MAEQDVLNKLNEVLASQAIILAEIKKIGKPGVAPPTPAPEASWIIVFPQGGAPGEKGLTARVNVPLMCRSVVMNPVGETSYARQINWGDKNMTSDDTVTVTGNLNISELWHTYTTPGTYKVVVQAGSFRSDPITIVVEKAIATADPVKNPMIPPSPPQPPTPVAPPLMTVYNYKEIWTRANNGYDYRGFGPMSDFATRRDIVAKLEKNDTEDAFVAQLIMLQEKENVEPDLFKVGILTGLINPWFPEGDFGSPIPPAVRLSSLANRNLEGYYTLAILAANATTGQAGPGGFSTPSGPKEY